MIYNKYTYESRLLFLLILWKQSIKKTDLTLFKVKFVSIKEQANCSPKIETAKTADIYTLNKSNLLADHTDWSGASWGKDSHQHILLPQIVEEWLCP
jgi:hypothetical protein